MVIYTRKGDDGKTDFKRGRVKKSSDEAEAIGALDELNAWLGLCHGLSGREREIINLSIKKVSSIMALISGYGKERVNEDDVMLLESACDKIEKRRGKVTGFSEPYGSRNACFFNIARTVCRRAERRVVKVMDPKEFKNELAFMNRLSDLLFLLFLERRKERS